MSKMSLEKVIILGCGSYNPLTYMHLRMFEIAKEHLNKTNKYEVIGGIMSPVSDQYATKKYLAPIQHRIKMIQLALKPLLGRPNWVQLNTWECKQDRWMRTLEVLAHHRCALQNNVASPKGKIRIMLICGSDMFETFNVPNLWDDKDIEEIVRDYGLLVIYRENYDPWKTLRNSSKSPILLRHEQNICIIDPKVPNNISSTFIRQAIANNESIRYLTDDSIIEYIESNQLYR